MDLAVAVDSSSGTRPHSALFSAVLEDPRSGATRRTILADGQLRVVSTSNNDPYAILREAGVMLSPHDEVVRPQGDQLVQSQNASAQAEDSDAADARSEERTAETSAVSSRGDRPYASEDEPAPASVVDVEVRRAVPLILHEKGLETQLVTTSSTLAEGLAAAGVDLQEGDRVVPALDTPISPGLHVYLRRSVPVSLDIAGSSVDTRTTAGTVAEVLAERGVAVGPEDRIEPPLESVVEPDMHIALVQVEREKTVERETVDFEVERRPDPDLEVGQQRIEPGQDGIVRREVEIVRENGAEVSRTTTREWVDSEPQTGVLYYGTKKVIHEMDSPDGEIQYSRSMSVYTTWYNASHGDKPRSSPWYGITATGMRAGRGVVAVDPSVIPLGTRLYIPGYGIAIAGDTGGGVRGAHIDLGFEEDEVSPWRSGWVTVYILD